MNLLIGSEYSEKNISTQTKDNLSNNLLESFSTNVKDANLTMKEHLSVNSAVLQKVLKAFPVQVQFLMYGCKLNVILFIIENTQD
uniref:Uncharacterized protein n=1 Tax=Magallana gigas TaxID=29159 RepID=K1P7A5_MAGGI